MGSNICMNILISSEPLSQYLVLYVYILFCASVCLQRDGHSCRFISTLTDFYSFDLAVSCGKFFQKSALGLPKFWGSIWRPEHFTTLCFQEHFCREAPKLPKRGCHIWCLFSYLLDLNIDSFAEIHVHSAKCR